jgi:tetratricopeptide (TPR) repeat protein
VKEFSQIMRTYSELCEEARIMELEVLGELHKLKARFNSAAYTEQSVRYKLAIKYIQQKLERKDNNDSPDDLGTTMWLISREIAKYYAIRGEINYYLGKYLELYRDMEKAITYNRDEPLAHRGLALYYLKKKEYEKALGRINRAINLDGGNYEYYLLRGIISYQMKNAPSAIENLLKSIELNANDYLIYEWLGTIYTDLKRWRDAEESFTKSLELEPNNSSIIDKRNYVQAERKKAWLAVIHASNK